MKGFRFHHFLMIGGVAVVAVATVKTVAHRTNIPGVKQLGGAL